MLKIGEFAGLTGLSVKALRHYDETGVLVPAAVDDRSAYRLYDESQVRAGVTIRALRDAGVPLPAVSAAIAGGDAEEALEAHRAQVLEQRVREDSAFRTATSVLRALSAPIAVGERSMPVQHFVGQVITIPIGEADSVSDADANDVFGVLFARLQGAGFGPNGPFWTALRAGERGMIEIVCCWPTPSEVPEDVRGREAFSAVLPARTELFVTWRPAEGDVLPDEALHPAVVGLFDAAAERGLALGNIEVRQAVLGQSADDYVVELSVTVS